LGAAAFTAHPYQWNVIGWPSDIESWTMEDLRAHFKMGYAPNNCTLVVVGAASFEEVMGMAKKYLEPIPAQAPPPPVRTKEPEQKGERRVKIEKASQLPLLMLGYHVGDSRDADYPVLAVIEALLTAGKSARLTTRMVDKEQMALQVQAENPMKLDPGLFQFLVQPRSGVSPERAEAVLYEELEKLKTAPVSVRELDKARNLILAAFYQQLKTISGKANLLGQYEIYFGGYDKLFSFDQRIAAVTAADIQRVAAKYFREQNRTVATLVPVKGERN
jgi:zinc protease